MGRHSFRFAPLGRHGYETFRMLSGQKCRRMAGTATVESAANHQVKAKLRRKPLWVALGCLIGLVCIFYALVLTVFWPFTEQNVIDILQERSLRSVTIGPFHRTYFPPGCIAEQIAFLHIKDKNKPPLITIRRLRIAAGYLSFLLLEKRLENVRVEGLHVAVPAKEPAGDPSPIMPLTYSGSSPSLPVANLYADGAVVEFYPRSTLKPFRLDIEKLALQNVDSDTALTYKTSVHTSEPAGTVVSTGSFGPWNPHDRENVPLHGSYRYENADLGSFQEIRGILSAKGNFTGKLGSINVAGSANVPEFQVTGASHKRALQAAYRVEINVLDRHLGLSEIRAGFDETEVRATGSIANGNLSLALSSERARIQDLMGLFISAPQSPMTGEMGLNLRIDVPPGNEPLLGKMSATGEFGVVRAAFAEKDIEEGLTRLSDSTKAGKSLDVNRSGMVLSGLKGQVSATGGVAQLSHTEFVMPGAHAWLDGKYNLSTYKSDLHGVLITTGNVSDAETGFKSFLLKVATPFMKHRKGNKFVPFKVTGPYGHTDISLDLGHRVARSPQ